MKTDRALLEFILEQIEKLQGYVKGVQEDAFVTNELLQDACILKITNIGEYSHRLSSALKEQNPQVDWAVIKATRNYYAHAYDRIVPIRIWETIQNQIPELHEQLTLILKTTL